MSNATESPTSRLGGQRDGNILGFYPAAFPPQPSTPQTFAKHVIQWFYAAKYTRAFEYELALASPSAEALAGHRFVCSTLITFGEFASGFAKANATARETLASLDVTAESIEAETRLLKNNLKMFHDSSMSMKEAAAVLDEVFGEA